MVDPAPRLGAFPLRRMRRLRRTPWIRALVAENAVAPADLIWGAFVREGTGEREAVPSLPGVARLSVDLAVEEAKRAASLGVPAIALFPVTPDRLKCDEGAESRNPDNLVCRATRAIKDAVPEIGVIGDVALDPYTVHGQDGLLRSGEIVNDPSLDALCEQAHNQAAAGMDVLAPSDMMDGRIGRIRAALDAEGHQDVALLAYAAKYASSFYGPFRDAVGSKSALGGGDKRTYQMNPANGDEALREVALDLEEGADMVMVKPGLPYLDVVRRVKAAFAGPTLVYHVSGEYAMLAAAAERGWLDWDSCLMETMLAFKRAGADGILTYAAIEVAESLQG